MLWWKEQRNVEKAGRIHACWKLGFCLGAYIQGSVLPPYPQMVPGNQSKPSVDRKQRIWGLHLPGSVGSPGSSSWEHLLPRRISRCSDFLGTGLCPPWSLQVCGAFLSPNHSQLSKLRRQWIFKVLNLCCNNISSIPQITMREGNRCVFLWLWEHEISMGEGSVDMVSRFAYDERSSSRPSFSFSTFLFWHLGREESPKLL